MTGWVIVLVWRIGLTTGRNYWILPNVLRSRRWLTLPSSYPGSQAMVVGEESVVHHRTWIEATCHLIVFKDKFNRNFFLRVVQEVKATEFMDLAHGGMSIIEYVARFIQLSRFALYHILDEEKKAKKFKRGLNSHIQTMMMCFDIRNFS
jgi:hypothetical protein